MRFAEPLEKIFEFFCREEGSRDELKEERRHEEYAGSQGTRKRGGRADVPSCVEVLKT